MARSLLKEPLLHFFLLGAALFGVYAWVNPQAFDDESQIVIGQGDISSLIAKFERTWNRAPTDQELQGLIRDFTIEEVFYREALAMGMDKNDSLIRRRLHQKMAFIASDTAAAVRADDAELQRYLDAHPEKFQRDATYSFEHVYLRVEPDAERMQAKLSAVVNALENGQPAQSESTLLPPRFDQVTAFQVDRVLGAGFADTLATLPLESWQGPVDSGLGLHFVFVESVVPGEVPSLEEAREDVEREWRNEKYAELKQNMIEALLAKYDIKVESSDTNVGGNS